MTKSDSVNSYLLKVRQVHDQLEAVGFKVENEEIVNMTLNGFPTSWE
jgi:hypothetical protein